jgi:WD40 repeat protein
MSLRPMRFSAPVTQVFGQGRCAICIVEGGTDGEGRGVYWCEFLFRKEGPTRIAAGHDRLPWRVVAENGIVSYSDDGTVRLWQDDHVSVAFPSYEVGEGRAAVRGEFAAFSPAGRNRWLATAFEQTVTFREPIDDAAPRFRWTLPASESRRIMSIRFDPSGRTLFAFLEGAHESVAATTKFYRYNIESGEDFAFKGTHGVSDGGAVADGRHVVTWDGGAEIVLWDLETRQEVRSVKAADRRVFGFALNAAGETVATVGDDGVAKFWDANNLKRRETKLSYKHEGAKVIQFSPDGKYLVTLSDDGWLKVWDAPSF